MPREKICLSEILNNLPEQECLKTSSFTLHSPMAMVVSSMGPPDSVEKYYRSRGKPNKYPFYQMKSDRVVSVLWGYNFLITDPIKNRASYFVSEGFQLWRYGESHILLGHLQDCWGLDCDCTKPNFVRGWFDAGNLKLMEYPAALAASFTPKSLNYLQSPQDVLKSQGNPFLVQPETPTERGHGTGLGKPIDEGGMRFTFGKLRKKESGTFRLVNDAESSYVQFRPGIRILIEDISKVRERGKLAGQWVPEEVISFENVPNPPLRDIENLGKLSLTKRKLEEENKSRFLALMEFEDFFANLQSPEAVSQSINTSSNSLKTFLDESADLSAPVKGLKFEQYCQVLFEAMGFTVERIGGSGDRGVDLKASRRGVVSEELIFIQCKHQPSVSADVLIQTFGMVKSESAKQGIVISTGTFTADAKSFASETVEMDIIDIKKLEELSKQFLDS